MAVPQAPTTTAPSAIPTTITGETQTMPPNDITQNHHRHHSDDDDDGHDHNNHAGTTCSPHKDHWHCPAGVPTPTTPPPTAPSSSAGGRDSRSASNARASSSSTRTGSGPTSTGAAPHMLVPGSAAYAIFGAVALLV
ncbi:hypothetical protein CP532_0282 [Ophiocordyceps camponoti-leonardi (nom. inval.)]|nr:hypothetical protein CP532_0282 [Ophiocordyceps camponoti-leonardi (nom. inval.)]